MFSTYFKQAIRGIRSQKAYFLLNLLGLTTGITAFILIVLWVKTETSYDQFHKDAENIYRVDYKLYEEEVLELYSAAAVPVIGPMLEQTYPEVEGYTRFNKTEGVVKHDEVFFREDLVFYAESSFFTLFNFPLTKGEYTPEILSANKAVISESAALRYFGEEDPIGKMITFNGEEHYMVTGVAQNAPANSHVQFNILLSYQNLINRVPYFEDGWFVSAFYTYVRLAPGVDPQQVETKIPALVEEHLGDFMKEAFFLAEFKLRPLLSIHLNSNLKNELEVNGSRSHVRFMSIIALVVLVIAFINYINMATSRLTERASEVGVRKVMGAIRKHLLAQFLLESVIVNAAAVLLSLGLVILLVPYFGSFTGSSVLVPWLLLPMLLLVIFLVSSFATGIIPAIYLARLSPGSMMHGKGNSSPRGISNIRNGFVVFQFAVSVILIIGTIVIGKQLSFLQSQDLGVDLDQVLVLEGPKAINNETYQANLDAFRSEMVQLAHVKQMTVSTSVPGEEISFQPVYGKLVDGINTEKKIDMVGIDQHFINTYGLKLIAGRNFDRNFTTDIREVILNESALAYLGFKSAEEAIGKRLTGDQGEANVIGVVNDYNQQSLRQKPFPMIFCNRPDNAWYSLKVNASQADLVIARLESLWNSKFPGNPLRYFFLDEYFNRQYQADQKIGSLFMLFSVLAIFIASLGLLGLSAYSTARRTKEIGVRKVNGAKVGEVMFILNKDFMRWVVVAFAIATPIAYYVMNQWLQNFAYKTTLSWWIFALAGLLALGIALLTVSWQSWRAATRNPVDALRYE